ncbi:hypothetical protein [Agromyces sp. NPDC049794]|uniref:hypothetical protein n=1 Tax=unclassified Agromyces TaxID=2639701 RepID=UPI0033C4A2AE
MNSATLSPASGRLAGWAVRAGLALARWGRRRAMRRTDRERILRRMAERSAADAALAERDAALRATFPLL